MIVLDSEKALLIHVPKCGGKALRVAFRPDNPTGEYWDWRFMGEAGRWVDAAHPTLDVLRNLPDWELFKTHAVIAVVRNPVTRFFSALREHCRQHQIEDEATVLAQLDEVRIAHDPRYIHFCPMHRYTHIGAKRHVDFIARTENLHDDLRAIGVKCRFGAAFFDAIDRIPVEAPEPEPDSRFDEWIVRFYQRDFMLFGYKMPEGVEAASQDGGEFDRLLIDPTATVEWDGDLSARPAYERLRAVQALKAHNAGLAEALRQAEVTHHHQASQIHELQQHLNDRQTALEGVHAALADAQAALAAKQTEVEAKQEEVNWKQAEIAGLMASLEQRKRPKWVRELMRPFARR